MEQPGSRQSKPASLKMWSRPSASACGLDGLRAGDDHGADVAGDLVAGGDAGRGAQIFNAAVGAGADEDAIDRDFFERRAGFQIHVLEARSKDFAVELVGRGGGVGHSGGDGRDHAGAGAPADVRNERGGVDDQFAIEFCAGIGGQLAPLGDCACPRLRLVGRSGGP